MPPPWTRGNGATAGCWRTTCWTPEAGKRAPTSPEGTPPGFPVNDVLGLTLARALVAAGRYREADALLSRLEVLPYEGAGDGRLYYRQAKLMLAVEAIGASRWAEATRLIAAARLWPERLGAGKPYDDYTDERLEDWLLADVLDRRGKRGEARALWTRLAADRRTNGSAGDILPLWALQRLGRGAEAAPSLAQWPAARTAAGPDGAVLSAWAATRPLPPSGVR